MNARSSHALTALPLLALAFAAAPAAAQQVAPPPVTATQADPAPAAPQLVAPPPVVATTPTAPATVSDAGSATAIDPQAAANAAAEQAQRRPATRSARAATAPRAPAPVRAPAPAAVAAAPVAAEAPPAPTAPAGSTPPAASSAPAASEAPAASQAPAPAAAGRDGSILPWIVAALAAVAIAAGLVMWRRRRAREEAWEETAHTTGPSYAEPSYDAPAYAEPVAADPAPHPVTAPAIAAAAPVVAAQTPFHDLPVATVEEASVVHADADDVEVLTAAAPVADRPWLELAMRPVRAGTTDDDARVEIELTVGNAGPVDAEDVRVSAFMLADADDGEIERMLVAPPAVDTVEPLRIGAGEGARVDAALTLPRASLASEARFRPVVIAEARYRLPGGGEGRTAASFDVGVTGDPDAPLAPVTTAGTEMRDDVEARLHRAAEHA